MDATDTFGWRDGWRLLVRFRLSIAAITVAATLIAAALAWALPATFRAEVLVNTVSSGGLDSDAMSGQLKGLASLAGVDLGGSTDSEKRLAVLKSRMLAERFVSRHKLLPVLLPETSARRTSWFAVKRFREKMLSIRQDARSGLVTVAIEWRDPAVAARWANDFVALANELLAGQDKTNAERNIAFLNRQAEQTTVVELRRMIYGLIEAQTKTLMLADSSENYAFEAVDPAVAPELKAKPARLLIVLAGAIVGFTIALLIAVVRTSVAASPISTATAGPSSRAI